MKKIVKLSSKSSSNSLLFNNNNNNNNKSLSSNSLLHCNTHYLSHSYHKNQNKLFFHFINYHQSLSLNQIISEAEVANNENNKLTIVISADKNTRYENVVSLMDGMRNVGITKLALAADKEGS
jgi:hypothetical protein